MLVLKTQVHETIWGGSRLTPYSGSDCKNIGHLYSVYCNEAESSLILNGAYKGKTLNEYFDQQKHRFGLGQYAYFPLVIALVEAGGHLSIQVHPDDDTAAVLDGSLAAGKNESWYCLEEPEERFIFNGCRCHTADELRQSILAGRVEEAAGRLHVLKGDYVYVEAGTLHALSKGSLVYEIEENAGCTYRFYDFGRERQLQISQAFFSVHPDRRSKTRKYTDQPIEEQKYQTQYFEQVDQYQNHSSTLQVYTLLDGEGTADGVKVQKGMSVILEPGETVSIEHARVIVAQPKHNR